MKKVVPLFVVVAALFAYLNRERLFVRDPLGSVTRAGVHEGGVQVFINYDNDVLLENDGASKYLHILQHGQPVGSPDALKCIHYLLCLTSGYPAQQAAVVPGALLESMTSTRLR